MKYYSEASCAGKQAFDEKELADRIAQRSSRNRGARLFSYRCPFCRAWHVGSAVARKHQRTS